MKLDYCVEQLDTPLENVGFRSHRSPDGGRTRSHRSPDGGRIRGHRSPDGGRIRSHRSPDGGRTRSHRSPDGGGDMELGNCETEREALKLAIKSLSVMVACWVTEAFGD